MAQDECYPDVTLRQWPNQQKNLTKTGTTFLPPYFPKAWTGTTALTITDSLVFRLKIGIL